MCAAHQYKAVAVQKPCQLCLPDSATQHKPWLLFAPQEGGAFTVSGADDIMAALE
jgi:hypothetical protein